MTDISKNEFETLIWLSVKDGFNQSINSIAFKYFTKQCPNYLNKLFELACLKNLRTGNNYLNVICPFQKTTWDKIHSLSLALQYGIKHRLK